MSYYAIDLETTEVHKVDEYAMRGVGLPSGWKWLDDLTYDEAVRLLPGYMERTERRLRALERTAVIRNVST